MQISEHNNIRYAGSLVVDTFTKIRLDKSIQLINESERILDYGCFDGTNMERLKSKCREVVGVDNSASAINTVKNKGFEARLLTSDTIPFEDNTFDSVLAGEVIEHIFDTDKFLSEIKRVLKPNGQLVISTPNLVSIGSRLTALIGNTPWMIEIQANASTSGHIRYFTQRSLKNILEQNGFTVKFATTDLVHLTNYFYVSNPALVTLLKNFGRIIIMDCRKNK